MLYLACLRVLAKGEMHFFDKPTTVVQRLDREERSLQAAIEQRTAPT